MLKQRFNRCKNKIKINEDCRSQFNLVSNKRRVDENDIFIDITQKFYN